MLCHAAPVATASSTIPEAPPLRRVRRARTMRRVALVLLGLFLALGLAGVWGVRTAEVTASGGGYDVTVEYAKVSRPGLATPWSVEVVRRGGFDGPVTIAVLSDYLDMFDENGLDPDPSKATQDGDRVIWEFEPPPGDTLSVSFDARIEPAVQWGRDGLVQVLDGDDPVVEVRYRTWVVP